VITSGKPLSHEFSVAASPEDTARHIALLGEDFADFGYRVEHHSADSVTLVRRYMPDIVWRAPLAFAVAVFLLGGAAAGSIEGARTTNWIAFFSCAVAVVLALVVKASERVTFSTRFEGSGASVIVTGSATSALRDYILSWDWEAEEEG
jgi:hypothetical protein